MEVGTFSFGNVGSQCNGSSVSVGEMMAIGKFVGYHVINMILHTYTCNYPTINQAV